MSKSQELRVRAVLLEEWAQLMEQGDGDWMLFDIAECDGDFLVVERGGKILAYLQHKPHEYRQSWRVINRLETRPYYKLRGYARRLVERVIQVYDPTEIIARGVRSSSIGFWQHLGFVPDGYGPEIEGDVRYSEGNFVWEKKQ